MARYVGYGAVGVGILGLGAGGILLGVAAGQYNNPDCTGSTCRSSSEVSLTNQAIGLANDATVPLVVGGIALATGGVLLIVTPRSRSDVAFGLGGTGLSVSGRF